MAHCQCNEIQLLAIPGTPRHHQQHHQTRIRTTNGLDRLTDAAVAIRSLYKRFGPKLAVNDLNLWVPKGTFFGLVGPNGAGKSTTLKIATGLLRPDSGDVWVAGRDVWADPRSVKEIIGVVPEDLRLFERLTGQEMLEYVGLLRGFDRTVSRRRAGELS